MFSVLCCCSLSVVLKHYFKDSTGDISFVALVSYSIYSSAQTSTLLICFVASFDTNSTVPTPDASADFYSTAGTGVGGATESQPAMSQPPPSAVLPTRHLYGGDTDPFNSPQPTPAKVGSGAKVKLVLEINILF